MDNIKRINDKFSESYKSVIRNVTSSSEEIQGAIKILGTELGKFIFGQYFTKNKNIETPMGLSIDSLFPNQHKIAIMTTKDDFEYLGKGLESIFENTISGYMNFEGQRGLQALNSSVREMCLPEQGNEPINTLLIGKAVLATGCTAISLTKTALQKYMPRNLIICSIFYSRQGVKDIVTSLPNADIILVGEPDNIDTDGMLVPGIGNLDERIKKELA
jgi:uracil phosphoribosyltransferase